MAANYRDLVGVSLPLPDLLDRVAATQPATVAAILSRVAAAAPADTVTLGGIISLTEPDLGLVLNDFIGATQVSALELLAASLDVVSADRAVDLALSVTIPGLVGAQTSLPVQERPAQSGWIMLGEQDATLHTAQTRLRSEIALAPNLLSGLPVGVSALGLRLPVYLELANARATLSDINCRPASRNDPVAIFQTGTGLRGTTTGPHVAELFLGSFTPAQFTAPAGLRAADLQFADILDVAIEIRLILLPPIRIGLLTLQARSHAVVGTSQTNQISFSQNDLAAGPASKRIATENLLGSSISSLLGSGNLQIRVKPGDLGLVSALVAPVVNTLIAVLPGELLRVALTPVDQTLNALLKLAGVELGTAELTLHAVHCMRPRLMR